MCGIDVTISHGDPCSKDESAQEHGVICRRGPHGSNTVTLMIGPKGCLHLSMQATVLHVRGKEMTGQPVPITLESEESREVNHCWLCWNGEAYEIQDFEANDDAIVSRDLSSMPSNNDSSDTDFVAQLLKQGLEEKSSNDWVWEQHDAKQHEPMHREYETTICFGPGSQSDPHSTANTSIPTKETQKTRTTLAIVAAIMSRVWNGEFAFCFVTRDALYYGRDVWGRRSLLVSSSGSVFKVASVATCTRQKWAELLPGRVYELEFETGQIHSLVLPTLPRGDTCLLSLPSPPPNNVSEEIWTSSFTLQHLLTRAVARRIHTNHATTDSIGILFSGGLDSVVLAALACEVLQEQESTTTIELFNVNVGSTLSADRKAAITSMQELKQLYPSIPIKLILVDILEWQEVVQHESHLLQLIHPKHTTMDLNIGTALWFASRGVGPEWLVDADEVHTPRQQYSSSCRIMLVGMGADEQMGGYGRHRTCFQKQGEAGLKAELSMDLHRLWERNLGRDDRVISDHGREARFPYLDPHVTKFLHQLPLSDKCNINLEAGVGDKQILRLVAQRLGLKTASGLVKRAIQFGSRMAHMSDTKRFNSRRKASGQANIPARVESNGDP